MPTDEEFQALAAKLDATTRRLDQLEGVNAVRALQYAYGYYLDKCLYDEVVDLFAEDGEVRFMGGAFRGKEGVRRLYCGRFRKNFTGGHNGPLRGFLLDHVQLQGIIHVAEDGLSAEGRFRALMQAGQHKSLEQQNKFLPKQWWEAGIYENLYVKQDGVWKIKLTNYNLFWQANYEKGWAEHDPYPENTRKPVLYPEDPAGPDAYVGGALPYWPETPIVPFHYPHPVTGKVVTGG